MALYETDQNCCYICLAEREDSKLIRPCACPRWVHEDCAARWQLQKAGTSEEKNCRFCHEPLTQWQQVWRIEKVQSRKARFGIEIDGKLVVIEAERGPEGRAQFLETVRELIGATDDQALDFEFNVKAPVTEDVVTLSGLDAFDSAMHCALHHASKRKASGSEEEPSAEATGQPRKCRRIASQGMTGQGVNKQLLMNWLRKNPPP